MNTDISAWGNAKWIGGGNNDLVLYSHYLPVFGISYNIRFDKPSESTKAGFIYGANDSRLMNKNMNIYHLESKENESYIKAEVDIAPLKQNKNAVINFYRVGFHPDDKKDIPFRSFDIPDEILNNKNKYGEIGVCIYTNQGHTVVEITADSKKQKIADFNMNPLGQGGDFIAFPVVGDIGFALLPSELVTFSDFKIFNIREPRNTLFEKEPLILSGGDKGFVEIENPSRNSMPMLRTTFDTPNEAITKARLYVTSRGIYEFYVNGKRVGDDYFNPGLTQYNKTHLYQTFDVTDLILKGKNAMGAILAEGWWSGGATFTGDGWNFFGDRQSILSKLIITYPDGREDIIDTNPQTWQYFNKGPVVYGSFFQGEVYDAPKEALVKDWSTNSYRSSGWKSAEEIALSGNISQDKDQYSDMELTAQFGQTAKKIKELTARSVEEIRPGVFVYDMGQNMVGVPSISLSGIEPNRKITLRFAEVKYPDLPEYEGNTGMIMLENIRAAMAQDVYITKGGNEIIQPRFTFHGYRFVEITGIDEALPVEAVKGIVISSIHELASSYETSNPKVNKLWNNIIWSTYGNFLSIPTDCPQRNERLGWSGDISVFARTATYLSDVAQFLHRHIRAMRDSQYKDGRFADVAPLGGGFGGVLWGSAGITVPWEVYQQYNDVDVLSEHYDAMKKYIHYILDNTIDPATNLIVQRREWIDLTDWLGPEDRQNDKSLLWEAYFLYDLEIMQKVAAVLGKQDDKDWYTRLLTERKAFFNKTYIEEQTGKTIFSEFDMSQKNKIVNTQTSYVLPIVFDVADDRNKTKLVSSFVTKIQQENKGDDGKIYPPYSLMTGFIGTAWINKALSDNGHTDIAYRLLQQTSYPSWLYSVEQGATTIWERLNSYTHSDGFGGNNQMNSFNHYSFGAVGAWMYNYSLGIDRDDLSPGFKHFNLHPDPDPTGEMTFAKGHYDSMYGRIESSWEKQKDLYTYRFVVPANTSATLTLNAVSEEDVKESGKPFSSAKGVEYIGTVNNKQVFRIQSGLYNVTVDM